MLSIGSKPYHFLHYVMQGGKWIESFLTLFSITLIHKKSSNKNSETMIPVTDKTIHRAFEMHQHQLLHVF